MAYNKETEMYEGYIYKIYNDVNDKVYIGQTIRTVNERWKGHLSDSKHNNEKNNILHAAIRKYGFENFHIVELYKLVANNKNDLKDILNKKEINTIKEYNSIRPNGYNIDKGGNSVSYAYIPVDQYDLDLNFIKSYESLEQASIETKVNAVSISACCKHKVSRANNYIFVYKDEVPNCYKKIIHKVKQYSINGEYIKTFINALEASKELNLSHTSITNCCNRKKYKTVGKYIFRYEDNDLTKDEIFKILNKTYDVVNSKFDSVCQYNVYGILVNNYENISIASNKTGLKHSDILNACKRKFGICGEYIWCFYNNVNDYFKIDFKKLKHRVFPIINQYDINNNFVKQYCDLFSIRQDFNCKSSSAFLNCCNHISKSSFGYKWFWSDDESQPDKTKIIKAS